MSNSKCFRSLPRLFFASGAVETVSGVVYEQVSCGLHEGDIRLASKFSYDDNERVANLADGFDCARNCLGLNDGGGLGCRSPFLLWHRVEEKFEEEALKLLGKENYRQSHEERHQGQFLQPLETIDFCFQRDVNEHCGANESKGSCMNNDDHAVVEQKALPATLSTRPPSVDCCAEEGCCKEAAVQSSYIFFVPSDRKAMMMVEPQLKPHFTSADKPSNPGRVPVTLTDGMQKNFRFSFSHAKEKDGDPSHLPHSCVVSSPATACGNCSGSGREDVYDQTSASFKVTSVEKGLLGAKGHCGKNLVSSCFILEGSPLQSSERNAKESTMSLLKTGEVLTPEKAWRELVATSLDQTGVNADTTYMSTAVRKYFERCIFCTPPTGNRTVILAQPRPKCNIIGSWRSLSAHCKRSGLKTAELPLQLKMTSEAN